MKRGTFQAFTLVWLAVAPGLLGQEATDTPYVAGLPAYEIGEATDREFDEAKFFDGKSVVTVEGRKWIRQYNRREGATAASDLQITRNYANAIRAAGGTVFFEGVCEGAKCGELDGWRFVSGRLKKGDKEVWVSAYPHQNGQWFELTVLEKQAMKQDVAVSGLWEELSATGRVAIYVNFETNKADIQPDSNQILDEVAGMLNEQKGLSLVVEGHTDNVGTPAKNKTLSEARARSVVAALVGRGIEGKRLSAAGFGAEYPIADNRTEEGRAKNRRVELVKK